MHKPPVVPAAFQSPTGFDQRTLARNFDIIGDVHGCYRELHALLRKLGYDIPSEPQHFRADNVQAPDGRCALFVGDLVDRGSNSMTALKMVMALVAAGQALCVCGNHDDKFMRWLKGRKVSLTHGLDGTIADFEREPSQFRDQALAFLSSLPMYLWLDRGALAIAHAGILEGMLGSSGGDVRRFCLYGDTSGERDSSDLPIRYHWAAGYRGKTTIVYGHTPLPKVGWVNNTICIDTGCCFGGALTALRWPERDIISVEAEAEYTPRRRPFGHPPIRPHSVKR